MTLLRCCVHGRRVAHARLTFVKSSSLRRTLKEEGVLVDVYLGPSASAGSCE